MTVNQDRRRALVNLGAGTGALLLSGVGVAVTPSQTEGPFYPTLPAADGDADLSHIAGHTQRAAGQLIAISGVVRDESGAAVANAIVDVWQANAHGRYHHEADTNPAPEDPHFQGWARLRTGPQGEFSFRSIKPGPYQVSGVWSRPPHIHFKVARRGYHELTTQMYFAGDPLNESDRLLQQHSPKEQAMLVVDFAPATGQPDVQAGRFELVIRRV